MPMRSHLMRVSRTCAIAACAIGAAGCAILYGRARTEEMAVANAAMSDATGAGASQYAATDYRNAQRKLDRANDALAARDNEAARNLAEEAAADAKLAAGRAELRAGGLRVIDRLAEFLREYPQRRVSIEGFTDSVGNASSNQALSEERASVARIALVKRGIDATRVVARGFGESYPVASNGSGIGRQMNRRVEIVISDQNGMIGSRGGTPLASARVR